jgi:hypothetical protein
MMSKHTPGPKEQQANVCLACAAPELLEALENIIEAYKQGYEVIPNILAVRNAIAKAKGEWIWPTK